MTISIEQPHRAATLPDFHPPMIVNARYGQSKRQQSGHEHPTKHSNKEYAYHFLHFPFFTIVSRGQCGPTFRTL
jgi:hypothetical protein